MVDLEEVEHQVEAGAGGGGSSYISGHVGCDAIAETSTQDKIVHTGQAKHYSGYGFTNTVMIDGLGYQWSMQRDETGEIPKLETETGKIGNGQVRISLMK